jgi:hypothetical protein
MTSTGRGWFRDLSIETKMLAIILPLVAVPMIVLGTVGYVVSTGQATASAARYLKERASIYSSTSPRTSPLVGFTRWMCWHIPQSIGS